MTYRVLIALGLTGVVVACGSGGAGFDFGDGAGPQSPGTNSQSPDYNDQGAPGSPNAAPSNTSQAPSSSLSPPNSQAQETYCVEICNQLVSHGCTVEEGCPAACEEYVTEAGVCSDEGLAWLACLVRDPTFDCFQESTSEQNSSSSDLDLEFLEICPDEFDAYYRCAQQTEPPDTCSVSGGCNCDSECDSCMCAFDGDATQCEQFCGGTPGTCTIADSCAGCETACDVCLCAYSGDTTQCATTCGSGTGEPCTLEGDACAGCGGDLCATCVCAYSGDTTMCVDYCP